MTGPLVAGRSTSDAAEGALAGYAQLVPPPELPPFLLCSPLLSLTLFSSCRHLQNSDAGHDCDGCTRAGVSMLRFLSANAEAPAHRLLSLQWSRQELNNPFQDDGSEDGPFLHP